MGQLSRIQEYITTQSPLLPSPPILKMSKAKLHTQAKLFLEHFSGKTSYAVKANAEAPVIAELVKAGINLFDVASPYEMKLIKEISPSASLHYHNPIRSKQEVALALSVYDCKRFSVDHEDALQSIFAQTQNPNNIEIAIRFRMETQSKAIQSFKSKFGVLKEEAISLLSLANAMGFKTGLTFHPGSQTTSPAPYLEHMQEAFEIQKQLSQPLQFLNIGGGFPAHYKMIETETLPNFFKQIDVKYHACFNPTITKLECEPGRALVAGAGTLVTDIKAARVDRRELYLNDGIYGGLMEFHQFPDLFPEYSTSLYENTTQKKDWTVYGPTCDPIDVLPYKLSLPSTLKEGDKIEFHGVGAYSTATATRFNGYGAIEVRMI